MKRLFLILLSALLLPLIVAPVVSAPAVLVAEPAVFVAVPAALVAVPAGPRLTPIAEPPILADPHVPPAEVAQVPIALLIDLSSGRTLYAKEPDRRFMPASITKVMTLFTAFDLMHRGTLKPDQRYRMSAQAFKDWRRVGSTMFLDPAMNPSINDLLLGIATISANDATIVLAEGAVGSVPDWVALMNAEARRIGMKDSHFGNPSGWMDEGETYVTAHDLAKLAEAMIVGHPGYYHRYIGHKTLTWNGITQHNHDPILGWVQGADGIKTGFTNQAGYGFLGTAERGGRRLVIVIAGADKAADRTSAARALIDWGFAAFDSKPMFAARQKIGEAQVQGGTERHVSLITPSGFAATIPKDPRDPANLRPVSLRPVSLRIVYDGPLEAPVQKGSIVASLEIRIGSAPPQLMPLVAGETVGRANWLARLRNGLFGLVL